jgi:glucosamine--fructose-6-phosphate aminotransferase (isomerizing)
MCGIIGYIGHRDATAIILEGLRRLEYRGYDSAGLAVVQDGHLALRRHPGKIRLLQAMLRAEPAHGSVGLGHTRWATHGRPTTENAHPHTDCSGSLVVVHNGIIENYLELRERLIARGHVFHSETDTEVLAHLVELELDAGRDLVEAVRSALGQVRGSYAIAVLSKNEPERLVAAKLGGGAVVVGFGEGEAYLASDVAAILPYTRDMIVLEDAEVAVLTRTSVALGTLDGDPVVRAPSRVDWSPELAQRGPYPTFMLKEIHEQPRAVTETFRGRIVESEGSVDLPMPQFGRAQVERIQRVVLLGCGTSYHAALAGRFMVERLSGVSAEVDLSSEYRYRDLCIGPETLVVAISQSGETADTLGAVKAVRTCGAPVLAITNVVGSSLAREATGVLYTQAGPEIGVASTKTFTSTVTACYLLALGLGRRREHLSQLDGGKLLDELLELPELMQRALAQDAHIRALAEHIAESRSVLYLGRGVHYPVALEGALKLKELSYIHAEGYAGGEMKHGPIALIDRTMPVVVLAPRDASYDRMVANLQEVRAREGRVIAICHEGDDAIAGIADHVLTIPPAAELLTPLVSVLPLQLLAHHVAALRQHDVDQPRNLAKSVTVE